MAPQPPPFSPTTFPVKHTTPASIPTQTTVSTKPPISIAIEKAVPTMIKHAGFPKTTNLVGNEMSASTFTTVTSITPTSTTLPVNYAIPTFPKAQNPLAPMFPMNHNSPYCHPERHYQGSKQGPLRLVFVLNGIRGTGRNGIPRSSIKNEDSSNDGKVLGVWCLYWEGE